MKFQKVADTLIDRYSVKTSNVRRFDSLNPRLYEAQVFFTCPHAARIDLAAFYGKAMQISFLKL
jgi:hypothetical protein